MMKLLSVFTALIVLTFASSSQADVTGLGWDAGKSQLTLRLDDGLDLGFGGVSDESLDLTMSAALLGPALASSETFKAHTVLGADYDVDAKRVDAFVGVMPEVVFGGHLAFSTKFGLNVPVYNDGLDLHFGLMGSPVNLTQAVNFKVLF